MFALFPSIPSTCFASWGNFCQVVIFPNGYKVGRERGVVSWSITSLTRIDLWLIECGYNNKPTVWTWFIPPIYGDLGNAGLLFYQISYQKRFPPIWKYVFNTSLNQDLRSGFWFFSGPKHWRYLVWRGKRYFVLSSQGGILHRTNLCMCVYIYIYTIPSSSSSIYMYIHVYVYIYMYTCSCMSQLAVCSPIYDD